MHIEHIEFRGGACIRLLAEGATALVALRGALVCSWIPADGRERLFLGERARLDGSHTVHGGVPVVFPQFAERGPLPQHGFARTSTWQFDGVEGNEAVFALAGDGVAAWPHPHRVRLRAALDATRLTISLDVANTGDAPFAFSAALHSYLRVADIATTTLEGLQGCDYEDKVNGGTLHREHNYEVTFDGEVDRIYADIVAPLALIDGNDNMPIEQDGFGDVVVWNPGAQLAARFGDLSPGDHLRFVCVEAAQVVQPVVLGPGERWTGMQRLG